MKPPSLKRHEDWPTRLDQFLAERREQPFIWGRHDCCLFASDAIHAMTGTDVAADFPPYDTALGARKALKEYAGASSVAELADWIAELYGIREIPPSFAQRGDVVLLNRDRLGGELPTPAGQTLGIVALDGEEIWAPGEFRLVSVPLEVAERAWRI